MRKFFVRTVIVLVLLLALQGPELIDQYLDHLRGHVAELKYQVGKLSEFTGREEGDLKPLIATWLEKNEIKEPALFISSLVERYETLQKDLVALADAKFWNLPFTFMLHFDRNILEETLSTYRWGFSITLGAIPFVLLGAFFSYLLLAPFQKRKKTLPPE